ncbi:MAG TPA: VWA domain-containing protein [Acidobacteriaceae bacterium]|jgi:VWFA-related protein|nr:VWA domain-containing protein [Acidobacteriaceae bacterium]
MRWRWVPLWLPHTFFCVTLAAAQTSPPRPYTLKIPVSEISLTFHAADMHGKPLTHLTRGDLRLTDNGRLQTDMVMLQEYDDLPIRAGFLFDASASMMGELAFDRAIIHAYAAQLLRRGYDLAFVEQFDTETFIRQDWTDRDAAIASGAARVGNTPDRLDPLTAIFDSLYTTCRDQWKAEADRPTGNFILLFSDGEDDASHANLSEAVDMCQRTRTAIYAMVTRRPSQFSGGYRTLEDLTQQTGGRLFVRPHGTEILQDLQMIEAEQRDQYRLVYKPSNFKADSSFHRIRLRCSASGARVVTRSGYYAFPRP